MSEDNTLNFIDGPHDPSLLKLFGLDWDEFRERAERGRESALFRRWILNEWAGVQPGELELSNRRQSALHDVMRPINYRNGIAAFAALAGSYLLEGTVPPCIK